jgi:hypothetical protein
VSLHVQHVAAAVPAMSLSAVFITIDLIKERYMRTTLQVAGALALMAFLTGDQALAETSTIPLKRIEVRGDFEGKDGKTAKDISGISCLAANQGKRTCLLIDDENRDAQFATLEDEDAVLKVGNTMELIGKDPNPDTRGKPPKATCKEDDGFKDLDGEGVAYVDSHFYVVGSHGCSRKNDYFRLSSFILAQSDSDPDPNSKAVTTYRVSEVLQAKEVKSYFVKDLETENGLNIEGIAAISETLWFGLRAPVIDGKAYLLSASIADLFHPGHDLVDMKVGVFDVGLGGRGIRDMAPLPDGRLLILAGPAQEQDTSYKLFAFDSTKGAKEVGTLESVEDGKAEGVTVLDVTGQNVTFLIVFDGLKNGAPHRGEATLPN